ncbi:MAG: UvrD-helicase domain-containing protein [Bacteriovoracaceae bacterium]|nr:UvrD-helicase domain-containing protein [Bacteriovoracaceae bacterium]
MSTYSDLNRDQKEAVLKTEGPVMILAGAGSGKTRTLVTRISYLIEKKRISPFQVLALTFSNKAAREMRERVSTEISVDVGALKITTFHAFCANILRSEATHLGLGRNFTIYDDSESKSIIKTLLKKRGISTKTISPYEVRAFIEYLKNLGHYRGRSGKLDYEVDEKDYFYPFFEEYEDELSRANALDFGGLITGVIQLFETFPEVLRMYQQRFKYVLIDEYQDTNRAQFTLMSLLCGQHRNICVVGDEDQSIYSWRGADIRNILEFEKVYPDVQILKLEQNYRSSKNIIEAASFVIARNTQRKGKKMWTNNEHGEVLEIIECPDDRKEAEFMSETICSLKKQKKIKYKEMAVFYRTNSQSRVIEDYLRSYKIPYRIVGGIKFYERKEIKDLLSYLRLVINSKDSLALSRIINVPARGIGAVTMRKLEQEAENKGCSLWEIVDDIVDNLGNYSHIKLSAKVKSSLREFCLLINDVKVMNQEKVIPSTIFEKILCESNYLTSLKANKDPESLIRVENLEEMKNGIKQFEEGLSHPTLAGYLESITLDTTVEDEDSGEGLRDLTSGEVSLMTVHGAKGLEYPYVFLGGAEEDLFPSFQSLSTGGTAIEEERRLFYVAMTRAMERLYITFARGRMIHGQIRFNGPSRFIHEIPEDYYKWQIIQKDQRQYDKKQEVWDDFEFSQENHYDYD